MDFFVPLSNIALFYSRLNGLARMDRTHARCAARARPHRPRLRQRGQHRALRHLRERDARHVHARQRAVAVLLLHARALVSATWPGRLSTALLFL